MLFDLIRDFFVIHVFGGHYFNAEGTLTFSGGFIGQFSDGDVNGNAMYQDGSLSNIYLPIHTFTDDNEVALDYMCLGDWLSTTATIISITIIVVLCCLFVYKIIKLIGGLIR